MKTAIATLTAAVILTLAATEGDARSPGISGPAPTMGIATARPTPTAVRPAAPRPQTAPPVARPAPRLIGTPKPANRHHDHEIEMDVHVGK